MKSSNNAIVNRLTRGSLSLWREVFLLVVEALHCSDCFSACWGVHFLVCEKDHGTSLALCLALLGCQGFGDIVPNGATSSYLGSSVYVSIRLEVSACSIDTDLNYDKNLNIFCMRSCVWNGREVANRVLLALNMWNSLMVVCWYRLCCLYFALAKDSKLAKLTPFSIN